MRQLPIRIWLLLAFLTTHGCECGGSGGCDSSQLKIEQTAPRNGAVTGRTQKFAVIVSYAGVAKEEVEAAVRIDEGGWLQCKQDRPSEQNIDGDRLKDDEIYFSCPVTAVTLAPGNHTAIFSTDTPYGNLPVREQAAFFHDTIPPSITPTLSRAAGGNAIAWSVTHDDDFDRVGLFVNGVEVTRSYEENGELILDESVRGRGARVEVRAYDTAGNDSGQVVELQ